MKKVSAILLAAVLVFSLAACQKPASEDDIPDIKLPISKEEWPIVDGATAFLPFYQSAAAKLLGISYEEAAAYVLCSTTDYAYPNLVYKQADLIFCLAPSEEQIRVAKSNNTTFEGIPILNEGFVFFVNENNPVDELSIEQLHDIYAGKITNWKEVGGNDEPILAYQRTEGSGSQTGLYLHVIDQKDVMKPMSDGMIANSMFGIVDLVSNYDNSKNALGYSYYYFVTSIDYEENIKLLKINGVEPNKQTISEGKYPMISKAYAVYRSNEPEDSLVRKIAQWCASSEGRKIVDEQGYVQTNAKDAEQFKNE